MHIVSDKKIKRTIFFILDLSTFNYLNRYIVLLIIMPVNNLINNSNKKSYTKPLLTELVGEEGFTELLTTIMTKLLNFNDSFLSLNVSIVYRLFMSGVLTLLSINNSHLSENILLVGEEGFEPPNTGTRTRRLTTWPLPIKIPR